MKPYDPRDKTGFHSPEIMKRQAQEQIDDLNRQYVERISEVAAKVFVVGGSPEAQKQAKLIAQEQEAIVVSASSLYSELFEAVKPYMPGNPLTLTVRAIDELERHVASVYAQYAPGSEWPRVPQQFIDGAVPDLASFIAVVQTVLAKTQQQPILASIAKNVTCREAVRLSYDDEPVAIVVTDIQRQDLPEFEASFFAGRPSVVIDLDKVKNVEGAFKSAAEKLTKLLGIKEEKQPPADKPAAEENDKKDETTNG